MNETQVGSAQPNDAVGGGQGGTSQGAVSGGQGDSNNGSSRLLGEVKSLKSQIESLKTNNQSLEMQKLEVEGDKDKMIDALKKQNQTLMDSGKQKDLKFAQATLGSQIKVEAAKMGCQDSSDLVKLIDISSIPVDPDTFLGDTDSIKMMLEETKKDRPYFFGKPAPTIQDVAQQNIVMNNPDVNFKNMTREQLAEFIAKNGDKI